MSSKTDKNQTLTQRIPKQARAREKVELILEAAIRIMEREGLSALTTNRLAERAGVSIGTLYQYFPNKVAVIDALAERELKTIMKTAMDALSAPPPDAPGGRARIVVRAILDACGGRNGANRLLLQHTLWSESGNAGWRQFMDQFYGLIKSGGVIAYDGRVRRLSEAETFVLEQATAGVIRGLVKKQDQLSATVRHEAEDALVRLIWTFMEPAVVK